VTIPPFLPETDLARIAPLPPNEKRRALENFRLGKPPYSYKPVRASFGDLLNLDTGLFGPLRQASFEHVAQVIKEASRFPDEATANIGVASGLYDQHWSGRERPFGAMGTTIGQKLSYWTPAVLAIDDQPVVPFFNPRRTPLPRHGLRFVFSMMHEQIRVPDPDYSNVRLCVCHFAATKVGTRPIKPTFDTGFELHSFDELQAMIAETYAIWAEVWAGRVEDNRDAGRGRTGFGF
jgi:hypothetical protein